MNPSRKILAIALMAALVGGVVGAFAFRNSGSDTSAASAPIYTGSAPVVPNATVAETDSSLTNPNNTWASNTFGTDDRTDQPVVSSVPTQDRTVAPAQVRTVTRTRYAHAPVNYAYTQPRQRTFWQKHRDKLTVAMGTGGGAILGALIGGKKGAAIGALAGAGGSALYTYKIRKRNRRY